MVVPPWSPYLQLSHGVWPVHNDVLTSPLNARVTIRKTHISGRGEGVEGGALRLEEPQ